LNTNKYAKAYKTNSQLWEGKKRELFKQWEQTLENRAEEGDIPEIVIRSLVNIVGIESVLRTFRGTKEKGLNSWQQTQKNKIHRETIKENLHKCN
jgi:transposase-like protein